MSRRRRRPNRLAAHTDPMHLFLTGAVSIVAFLFQGSLAIRVGQVLAFALLATLAGKRIRWGYFVMIVGSITAFNLLTPLGRVVLELGPVTVTSGALEQGLIKGFAIVGLVFISLFAVRPDLRLPGSFGGLVARLFFYFERVLDSRSRIRATELISTIDAALLDLYPHPGEAHRAPPDGGEPPARTDAIGFALMVSVVVVNIGLAVLF